MMHLVLYFYSTNTLFGPDLMAAQTPIRPAGPMWLNHSESLSR